VKGVYQNLNIQIVKTFIFLGNLHKYLDLGNILLYKFYGRQMFVTPCMNIVCPLGCITMQIF